MAQHESLKVGLQDISEAQQLFGQQDSFLRLIETRFQARVLLRSDYIEIVGEPNSVQAVGDAVNQLLSVIRSGRRLQITDVKAAVRDVRDPRGSRRFARRQGESDEFGGVEAYEPDDESRRKIVKTGEGLNVLSVHGKNGPIRPRTKRQSEYIEAIRLHDLVFGIGPAGTGKTYLAMAMAASALKS
ncbi:MAG: PhoH family protein, partial [Candidatus Poribacteria bacterium]|nr:PhoH family protein [Candidatus Poribacteria bacterium]